MYNMDEKMIGRVEYLGDGLYVVWDGLGIELRANDPVLPTDTVYLEDFVYQALLDFVERIS
jgi:hypothetical protein